MSKYGEDEDDEAVVIDQCDCCKSSMTALEFAYISGEDCIDMDMEIVHWLDSMKYNKLCHKCFSKLMEKVEKEEAEGLEALSEAMNEEAQKYIKIAKGGE